MGFLRTRDPRKLINLITFNTQELPLKTNNKRLKLHSLTHPKVALLLTHPSSKSSYTNNIKTQLPTITPIIQVIYSPSIFFVCCLKKFRVEFSCTNLAIANDLTVWVGLVLSFILPLMSRFKINYKSFRDGGAQQQLKTIIRSSHDHPIVDLLPNKRHP